LCLDGVDAGAERVEGAGDLAVLRVRWEIQRYCALPFEEGELDVVGEEEELG